jgi:tetratricopeptide (TPR) repeat protein
MLDARKAPDNNMHLNLLIWLGVVVLLLYFFVGGHKGIRAIAQAFGTSKAMNAVMAAYRNGDYITALQRTERLKNGQEKTGEYCFMRGGMLHHLGQLDESEAFLREAIPLHDDPRQKALVYNALASVLMDQKRFPEAVAFYENAGRAWPDRGSSLCGIAETWLRQGREFPEALQCARQAIEIDQRATGMPKEALDKRLGEDFVVLAWAIAANSGDAQEVESLLAKAFPLCGTKTKPVLAQIHYHAGKAYETLKMPEKARDHFRKAKEVDPKGTFGRLASEVAP